MAQLLLGGLTMFPQLVGTLAQTAGNVLGAVGDGLGQAGSTTVGIPQSAGYPNSMMDQMMMMQMMQQTQPKEKTDNTMLYVIGGGGMMMMTMMMVMMNKRNR